MPNNLTAEKAGVGMPGAGVDPQPMEAQGPQVDAKAMQTPPGPPAGPPAAAAPSTPPMGAPPGGIDPEHLKEVIGKQMDIDHGLKRLLARQGPITTENVVDMAVKLVAKQVMSAQQMAGVLKSLPQDSQDIREWLQQHAKTIDTDLEQMLIVLSHLNFLGPGAGPGAAPARPGPGAMPGGAAPAGPPPTLQ